MSSIDDRLREVLRAASYVEWPVVETPHAANLRRDGPNLYETSPAGPERLLQTEPVRGFWSGLEARTAISRKSWNNFFRSKQSSTPAMIEASASLWPQFAFWLVTGITDVVNGHVAPESVRTFPERETVEDEWSTKYFATQLRLRSALPAAIELLKDTSKDGVHLNPHVRAASNLVNKPDYEALVAIWQHREVNRENYPARLLREFSVDGRAPHFYQKI